VGYVKRDFFLGRRFTSLDNLNAQVHKWLKRVNSTVHGTTYQIPLERLKEENLNLLGQVPPYKVVLKETRKVSKDCYISFIGNKYSVPYRFAGRIAELQIFEGKFEVYVDYEKICEHEILLGNCRVARKKEHFQGLLSEVLTCLSKKYNFYLFLASKSMSSDRSFSFELLILTLKFTLNSLSMMII
jgi:hypothetical protein